MYIGYKLFCEEVNLLLDIQKSPQQENRPPAETGRQPRTQVTNAGWQEAPAPPWPCNYRSQSRTCGIQQQLLCRFLLESPLRAPSPRIRAALASDLVFPRTRPPPAGHCLRVRRHLRPSPEAAAPMAGHRLCGRSWCRALLGEVWALRELASYCSREQSVFLS